MRSVGKLRQLTVVRYGHFYQDLRVMNVGIRYLHAQIDVDAAPAPRTHQNVLFALQPTVQVADCAAEGVLHGRFARAIGFGIDKDDVANALRAAVRHQIMRGE